MPKIKTVKLFQTNKLTGAVFDVNRALNYLNNWIHVSILTVDFQFGGRWSGSVDTIVGHTSVLTCVRPVNISDCQIVTIVDARRSQSWICCDVQSLSILCPRNIRWWVSFNFTAKTNILSFHCGKAFGILGELRCNWKG